jgi:adenylate cyclase
VRPRRALEVLQRHADVAIAAGVFAFIAAVSLTLPVWNVLERRFFDLLTVATAKGQLTQPIVLVAINEESIEAMKMRPPWPRTVHARLVDRLAQGGAAVIALGVLISEPTTEQEDGELAKAVARAGNVVMAADLMYTEAAGARFYKRTDPLPIFRDAGAIPGLATITFDRDHFVRLVPPEPDAMWRQVLKVLQFKVPSMVLPQLPAEGAMIRYLGPDTIFDPVPYHLVLDATPQELKGAFNGRIVLVGSDLRASAEIGLAQSDLFSTPFANYSGTLTPGMKIQATVIHNALSGETIRPLGTGANLFLEALAALASFFAFRRWRPLLGAAAVLGVIAALGALAWYLFVLEGVWMAVAAPCAVVLIAYLGFGVRSYLAESRRKRELQGAFSRYVSPDVVDQIVANPQRLALGGERREITVLFTDLAGFTKMSEASKPEVVSQVLIRHFTALTEVVHANKGTVVQFIGDAIMAFWGAPLDDPDHALHAVEAAIEMQKAMEKLREELKAEGLPEIHMRVGVNTCEAIVGNMGSSTRFAYTAMGDGINLGSRLEGANKAYGTKILVSGETVSKLHGRIPVRRVDRVRVAGKSEAVDIFTPVADAALIEPTALAFEAYVRREWEHAAKLYREMRASDPADGVAARVLARIEECQRDPELATADGSVSLDKL